MATELFQKICRNNSNMTNEIDIMKKAVMYYDRALFIKRTNEDLYEHLIGSIIWLLKYTEKNGIILPNKQALYDMANRADTLFDEMTTFLSNDSIEPKSISDDRVQHDKNKSSDEEEYRTLNINRYYLI